MKSAKSVPWLWKRVLRSQYPWWGNVTSHVDLLILLGPPAPCQSSCPAHRTTAAELKFRNLWPHCLTIEVTQSLISQSPDLFYYPPPNKTKHNNNKKTHLSLPDTSENLRIMSLGDFAIVQSLQCTYPDLMVQANHMPWLLHAIKRQGKPEIYEAAASIEWHIVLQLTFVLGSRSIL